MPRKKNAVKFEVSFNLNTADGEKIDRQSIKDFKNSLKEFVRSWDGYFYSFGLDTDGCCYDRDIEPTAIKVKRA